MRMLSFVLLASFFATGLGAQQKPLLAPSEYGRWETLGRAVLSPDGEWLAYQIARVNEQNELRVRSIERGSTEVVPWGSGARFAPNSRWLAWATEPSKDERERLEREDAPVRSSATVLDLGAGEKREFDAVRDFSFDATGRFVALHGYAPDQPEGKGADLRIVDLNEGTSLTFGNVGEYAWSGVHSLIAMTISTGAEAGNGVQVYEASSGRHQSLDASDARYSQLVWQKRSPDLAVLRSEDSPPGDGGGYEALAWMGVGTSDADPIRFHSSGAGLAEDLRIVDSRAPRWSEDGSMIALGLRPREAEGEESAGDSTEVEAEAPEGEGPGESAGESDPKLPAVQIWHSRDRRIYPEQKVREAADQRRSLLAVWRLHDDRIVQLGSDLSLNTQLLHGWTRAIEDDDRPYGWGAMFGRPYRDVWVVDAETGQRSRVAERRRYSWASEAGGWLLEYDGEHYHSVDLESGQRRTLTADLPAVFADRDYDTPTDVLPPFGFGPGGWLEHDEAVLLYDEHDVWRVAPNGSEAVRLTRGAESGVTYRVAALPDDDVPGLDPDGSILLTMYGDQTEKRGYARLTRSGAVQDLVFEDSYMSGLTKADSADVYMLRSMAFDDPPDLFVAGPDLAGLEQVTDVNPFIDDYAWSRSELVDFTSESGRPLQFVLRYPAGYEPGQRVPTIVYTYEMLSPQMHVFTTPSERSYYNYTAWTQQGYAVLLPDIVYRARDPGVSALESVRAAVAKAVDMGVTDPDAVGLIGHSWGGYQATFLPTRTDIFAASVAGAPLTDFVSFMGQIHWNQGAPELSHWETGQGRMEVPFWEDPDAHRRNSPVHEVHRMETPLLMAFGNEDGVVDWDQGTEFYNFARRADKQMVLLVYEGEDHGFRDEANQVDYHRRILEWFGHYLKGEPAPAWITDGVPVGDLEDEKKRVAGKGASGD